MKITFLGTGTSQGIPVIGCECEVCTSTDIQDVRLRTSAMVTVNGKNIVIDVGPDFRQQMLHNQVQQIEGVLITHEHNDHVIGLDDVRPFNFRFNRDMPIYSTVEVQKSLRLRFNYAFVDKPYPGSPRFDLRTISAEEPFEIAGQSVIPIPVMHGKMPVLGFRFGDLTYITDAKTIDEASIQKIKGTKVLVLSALRQKTHHSHLSLNEAIAMIDQIQPEQTYLIHMSHLMGLAVDVNKSLPPNVSLAYDSLVVNLED